jgi:hypothetical protein
VGNSLPRIAPLPQYPALTDRRSPASDHAIEAKGFTMKKWLINSTIAVYLLALSWGILAHAVGYGTGAHPVMYFLVWDMFGGWASYESRIVIIGEGESGKYYELAPGPWGEFRPFGNIGRRNYDPLGGHAPKLALNAIRQTSHEPITRVIVVEACWAKKYNLPDNLWKLRYEEPKDRKTYYNVRHVFTPDGALVHTYPNWMTLQYSYAVGNNPRLQRDRRRGKPFFALQYQNRSRSTFAPGTAYTPGTSASVGSRLGGN